MVGYKKISSLILVSVFVSVSYAQDGQEKLIDTKTYKRDGKTITEKTYKRDTLGTYVKPKNVSLLTDAQRAAKDQKCKEAQMKAKKDPSITSFQYGEYSYDLNCHFLGKYVPPKEALRKEIVEVTVPEETKPNVTVPPEKHSFGSDKKDAYTIYHQGKPLNVSEEDYKRWNKSKGEKDRVRAKLFDEIAKKYKK